VTQTTEQQIAAIIRGIFDAFANHQSGVIEAAMHPDATVWDVFTPHLIRGAKERERFHADDQKQMQARGPLSWSLEPPEVTQWGDTAIACYYLTFAYQPPNATAGRVRITDVFRRFDGAWRVVHHHEGMVPAGVPPIAER
jgi:ketosteroid isomerase-like protein